MYHDSEWQGAEWVATTVRLPKAKLLFLNDEAPAVVRAELRGFPVEFVPAGSDLLARVKERFGMEDVFAVNYFSPKDLEYLCGWEAWRDAVHRGTVRQRRSLSGKVGDDRVKDLCGWNHDGLGTFAKSMGRAMLDKGLMADDKERMWDAFLERPVDFARYCLGDVDILPELHDGFVQMAGEIQTNVLHLREPMTKRNIPMTTGAWVAKTFEQWLYDRTGEWRDVFKWCLRKLGVLDPAAEEYEKNRRAYHAEVGAYGSAAELRHALATVNWKSPKSDREAEWLMDVGEEPPPGYKPSDWNLWRFMGHKMRFLYRGLDGASIRWFAGCSDRETAIYNVLVQGGRCVNEVPQAYRCGAGLDIDISSCYGSSLRDQTYPVGLPRVWTYATNEVAPTFGDWLDANEAELLPGLWQCIVSGKLTFDQDLIYSRLCDPKDIRRAVRSRDDPDKEDDDVLAASVMLRRQIINGVITSDILNAARAASTEQEWGEIRRLEVVTAAAYLKADQVDTLGQLCDAVVRDKGRLASRDGTVVRDERTRAWLPVPLEQFIGPLVDERNRLKAKKNETGLSPDEKARYTGLCSMYKLLVNTLFGDLASRFFPIGNVVVANNITARARVGVWMLAKALGLRQSITDGGFYTPDRVCVWQGPKPGLHKLANINDWRDATHPGRRGFARLGGVDWEKLIGAGQKQEPLAEDAQKAYWKERLPDPDKLAREHVRQFWAPYGLTFPFDMIEHKWENVFTAATWWNKGDYALRRAVPLQDKDRVLPVKYAVRGKDKPWKPGVKAHPTFALFDTILAGGDQFPSDLTYTRSGLLTVNEYRQYQRQNRSQLDKALRPGDPKPVQLLVAKYNNRHMPVADLTEYRRRTHGRNRVRKGQPVALFERHRTRGIAHVHQRMLRDHLR
jgi:hypothetical protein